jgi:hypothetical protein
MLSQAACDLSRVAVTGPSGERNASEMSMLTRRGLQLSRATIAAVPATVPRTISSSQRRPDAMPRRSVAWISALIGRPSGMPAGAGKMISRAGRREVGAQGTLITWAAASSDGSTAGFASVMPIV